MAFEEGLLEYLDNHAGLSREVDSRIYPLLLPQNPTFPAVTYSRVATTRLHAFERSFFPHPRFQFNCWAMNTTDKSGYEIAKDVAEQLVAALNLYWGAMGDETVQASFIDDQHDLYDPDTKVWHVVVGAVIWHEE